MILTVTLNPAIDKTARLDQIKLHALNRLQDLKVDAGGKGINVSKTIAALGGDSLATGFYGAENAEIFQHTFASRNISSHFLSLPGRSRTNLKLVDSRRELTEFNEFGFSYQEEALDRLLSFLDQAVHEQDVLVLAGSLPPDSPDDLYGRLTRRYRERGLRVFVDADGTKLAHALEEQPYFIKPNDYELGQLFGIPQPLSTKMRLQCGKKLLQRSISLVCISCGSEGSLLLSQEGIWKARPLSVTVSSTVGAGDAMVAAFAFALDRGDTLPEAYRLAVATSTGAVMTEGTQPPERELVEKLYREVRIEKFSE